MSDELGIFGKILRSFLPERVIKKLDKVAIVNLLGLFVIALYAVVDSIGNGVVALVYALGDVAANVLAEYFRIPLSTQQHAVAVNSNSSYYYFFGLLLGLFICLYIVKNRKQKTLW